MVEGKLDYMFDFDYFRFETTEGQKYQIGVKHETLRPTSIALFGPDGMTGENQRWEARDQVSTGPRIIWMAPSSDVFYLAVQNFGGKTGTYTLTISSGRRITGTHHPTAATPVTTHLHADSPLQSAAPGVVDIVQVEVYGYYPK